MRVCILSLSRVQNREVCGQPTTDGAHCTYELGKTNLRVTPEIRTRVLPLGGRPAQRETSDSLASSSDWSIVVVVVGASTHS